MGCHNPQPPNTTNLGSSINLTDEDPPKNSPGKSKGNGSKGKENNPNGSTVADEEPADGKHINTNENSPDDGEKNEPEVSSDSTPDENGNNKSRNDSGNENLNANAQ